MASFVDVLSNLVTEGEEKKTFKDFYGLSDSFMETMYAAAKLSYEQRDYGNALQAFFNLFFLDGHQSRYALGVALSAYQTKDFITAALFSALAALLDPKNPELALFAADTLWHAQNLEGAAQFYEKVLLSDLETQEGEILKQRASLALDRLKSLAHKDNHAL